MIEKLIVAGSGGQGVMLLGKVLAEAAMRQGRQVSWFPAYGAEVRGGTSHCMVTISDREIGSPYVEIADTLISLNSPSLEKFLHRLRRNGMLVLNSSLARPPAPKGIKILSFPFTDIAINLGNIKVANMVALGCYLAASKVVSIKEVLKVFNFMAPAGRREILEVNQKALQEGADLVNG